MDSPSRGRATLGTIAVILTWAQLSSAEPIDLTAFLEASRVPVGHPVHVLVLIRNSGSASVGGIQLEVANASGTSKPAEAALTLSGGMAREEKILLDTSKPGTFNVRVSATAANTRVANANAGSVEVFEAPGLLSTVRDVAPVIAALVVFVGTLLSVRKTARVQIDALQAARDQQERVLRSTREQQERMFEATRQQKAAEAVTQIVLDVAREYYGTVSGAVTALTSAMRRLDRAATPDEREHLLARCFFFFGTLLYKDNEFAFRHNLVFLPDLWAEAEVRQLVDDVLSVIQLTPSDESMVHKCFSDIAAHARGVAPLPPALAVRNLYEFENMLCEPNRTELPDLQRRIQEIFERIKEGFADQENIKNVTDIDRVLHEIMEYEFTVMFADYYQGETTDRTRPPALERFDRIVGVGRWQEFLETVSRLDAERAERETRRKASGVA
jgi:hypothetical protein